MMQDSKSAPLVQPLHLRKSRVECVSNGKSRPASDARSSRCTGTKESAARKAGISRPRLTSKRRDTRLSLPTWICPLPVVSKRTSPVPTKLFSVTRSPSRLTCDVGLVTSMRPMSLVQSFAGRLCCSIGRHRSAHEHLGELCGRGACPRFWPLPTPLGFLLPVHTEGCRPFEVLNLGKRRFSSCPDKQANNP